MRIALTGGASGIGAALLPKLAAAGHRVTAFDVARPDEPLDHWVETELGDPAAIDAAVAAAVAIVDADGPFDALINNAGLPPREGLAARVLAVNFLGFRRFLDGMLDTLASGGAIVNTASRAGAFWRDNLDEIRALTALGSIDELDAFVAARGIDHVRAYNLSKEAMIVQTIARTEEMIGRGLRMNSVSPAAVDTGILGDFRSAFGDRMARNVARAGRPGSAEEVADVIAFLASPGSAWLKGVDITIDGGMSAMAASDAMELPGRAERGEGASSGANGAGGADGAVRTAGEDAANGAGPA